MFSEFKIQHITTTPYNPSSKPVECFHRTFTAMLQTQGPGVQENWDLWLNASVLHAYNTTVSSSNGKTPCYAIYVWMLSNTTCGLDVPYTLCREENDIPLDWRHDGRETTGLKEFERSERRKSEVKRLIG